MEHRIMDDCTISRIGNEAWIDITRPGLLLRLKLTFRELREFIEVAEVVEEQLRVYIQDEGELVGADQEVV